MSQEKVVVQSSFPVLGIIGIIFIVMKLMGVGIVATWSWWLVLLPFYIGFLIVIGVVLFGLAAVFIYEMFKK